MGTTPPDTAGEIDQMIQDTIGEIEAITGVHPQHFGDLVRA